MERGPQRGLVFFCLWRPFIMFRRELSQRRIQLSFSSLGLIFRVRAQFLVPLRESGNLSSQRRTSDCIFSFYWELWNYCLQAFCQQQLEFPHWGHSFYHSELQTTLCVCSPYTRPGPIPTLGLQIFLSQVVWNSLTPGA